MTFHLMTESHTEKKNNYFNKETVGLQKRNARGWEGVESDTRRATAKSTSCPLALQYHGNFLVPKDRVLYI